MFDLRVIILYRFCFGNTQKYSHHDEYVRRDLHPDNEIDKKYAEEHPAVCRKALHQFVRTGSHIDTEQEQSDKTEIENESEIADVGCHIIATEVRPDVIHIPIEWILKVTVANDPSVKIVGKYNHILQYVV